MEGVTVSIRQFIAARLDEAEATARAAAEADPAPWAADADDVGDAGGRNGRGFGIVVAADDVPLWECEGSRALMMTAPTARHVAAHDPARVLRAVVAKRAILAAYDRTVARFGDVLNSPADTDADASAYSARAHMGLVLRLLATTDEDHPGFNPAWKLEA